jgi:hypothetical protein
MTAEILLTLYDQVWHMAFKADKDPSAIVRGSAAWLAGQEAGVTL